MDEEDFTGGWPWEVLAWLIGVPLAVALLMIGLDLV